MIASTPSERRGPRPFTRGGFAPGHLLGYAHRHGLGLVESVMAVALTGVVLVAALEVLGSARAGELTQRHRAIGMGLARDLMEEILTRPYSEEGKADAIGLDAGDDGSGRLLFDDVDDYDRWSASPPRLEDGNKMTEHAGFTRSVTVVWVEVGDLARTSASSTGLKRIEVTISRSGRQVARLVAFRSDAYGAAP